MNKVKVLVVDDSAVIRQVMTGLLSNDPGIEVLGAAADPLFALRRMEANWPDVIVLDLEMPRMDGITFLRKIMAERPTPVVMCSTFTEKGAETTVQALAAGAVEVITKPRLGAKLCFEEESAAIAQVIKSAARVRMEQVSACVDAPRRRPEALPAAAAGAMPRTTEHVVAIGTSTGGTHALEAVLTVLPRTITGIVIVQHMPEKFTAAFADRLDRLCEIEVREAADGDRVMPGRALIAPGGKHMLLKRSGARYYVEVGEGPLVNRHRPSVDVLFSSVARVAGRNALGIIMTGMGDDGAEGITEMHEAGARTLAQNEESCVVYGMPKEAVKRGGIDAQVSLDAIAAEIVRYGV